MPKNSNCANHLVRESSVARIILYRLRFAFMISDNGWPLNDHGLTLTVAVNMIYVNFISLIGVVNTSAMTEFVDRSEFKLETILESTV